MGKGNAGLGNWLNLETHSHSFDHFLIPSSIPPPPAFPCSVYRPYSLIYFLSLCHSNIPTGKSVSEISQPPICFFHCCYLVALYAL